MAQAESQTAPPPVLTESTVPLRLMLVEDHQDTAATLRRLLTRRGYEVQAAGSVSSALELAKSFDFDVLVSDIGLPDGTGVDLLRKLREIPGKTNLCGIALSGFGMDEDIARSKEAGLAQHLTKPVDFSQLQQCLTRIGQTLDSSNGSGTKEEQPALQRGS
jgi:CheY-like chemotaxis protein